jgi:hypothetical protein
MSKSMKRYYNKSKKYAPKYKIENIFMLNSKNLQMHRLTKKFNYKILEHFPINKVISPMAIKLKILDL